jgi:hypothetical protein
MGASPMTDAYEHGSALTLDAYWVIACMEKIQRPHEYRRHLAHLDLNPRDMRRL